MTNPNVIGGIGSVERSKFQNQPERPFHQDEQTFYLFHPPMSTENGKQLQEYFDKRTEVEREESKFEAEERRLVDKFDNLNKDLRKVMEKPTSSPEEEMKKKAEIDSIHKEIDKVNEEITKVREKIEEIRTEIDRINEDINRMIEIVIEDEHEENKKQQAIEEEKNHKKIESLINQL